MPPVLETSDLLQAAVARLKAFVNARGDSIGTICQDRVFIRVAPDNVTLPYIVITKALAESDPEFGNMCEDVELDARCVDTDPQQVERLGDCAQGAFFTWRISSEAEGLLTCGQVSRMTPEPDDAPELRDRHHVVVTGSFTYWPPILTASPAPP